MYNLGLVLQHVVNRFNDISLAQRHSVIERHQLSKNLEHIRVLVADICTSKYKRYYLASVIARKVELKAMAPTHCSFSVSGNSLEYLIGVSPEIMAYWNHRRINKGYAGTPSECTQIKEEHELEEHSTFQLHKAVVRHSFWEIRLHRTLDKEQIIVLEILLQNVCKTRL